MMQTRQLSLGQGVTVGAIHITQDREIVEALAHLGIPHPKPVIVLVGGAGGIGWWDQFPMSRAIRIIAQLAEETGSVVVDGGTQAGIMTEIGVQRKRKKYTFPLIGVVFDQVLMQEAPSDILDPNHTHFILIPGTDWGDESDWISNIATVIAGAQKSITILVNGGEISSSDVKHSLQEDRPIFVMRGTGRLADEITLGKKIIPIDITEKPRNILAFLKAQLV
jgi:hypothetical protein